MKAITCWKQIGYLQGQNNGSTHSSKARKPSCRKIDEKKRNNRTDTQLIAYSETHFAVPTIGYVDSDDKKLNQCVLSFLTRTQ